MRALIRNIVTAVQDRSGSYAHLDRLDGLDDVELGDLQADWPAPFPDDLSAALQIYGRTVRDPELGVVIAIPLARGMGLLTADQIHQTATLLRRRSPGALAYWDRAWLPVASDDPEVVDTELSAYDMVELAQDSPIRGTVFRWTADQGRVTKLAPSFRAYLATFRRMLDQPGLEWDEPGGFRF